MPTITRYVKCPVCGWHQVIITKGTMRIAREEVADSPRGMFTFRKSDPQVETFISLRNCLGGKKGFPQVESISLHQVESISLHQAKSISLHQVESMPEYQGLIASLREQTYLVLKVLVAE